MANVFQRVHAELTASLATRYTCPSSTQAIVIGLRYSNIDGTNSVNVEGKCGASGSTKYFNAKDTPVPAKGTFVGLEAGEKLVLEASEIFEAKASATGDCDIMMSILEIS